MTIFRHSGNIYKMEKENVEDWVTVKRTRMGPHVGFEAEYQLID